jgi:hypothetical protein
VKRAGDFANRQLRRGDGSMELSDRARNANETGLGVHRNFRDTQSNKRRIQKKCGSFSALLRLSMHATPI